MKGARYWATGREARTLAMRAMGVLGEAVDSSLARLAAVAERLALRALHFASMAGVGRGGPDTAPEW